MGGAEDRKLCCYSCHWAKWAYIVRDQSWRRVSWFNWFYSWVL